MTQTAQVAENFGLLDFFGVFVRRWKFIAAIMMFSMILGATYLSFQTPLYTASALIQIHDGAKPLLGYDDASGSSLQDRIALQSELDILRAPDLTLRVIKTLSLDSMDEFQYYSDTPQSVDLRQAAIIRKVQDRLSVDKSPLSYTVKLSFDSAYAERAKRIANAYAAAYIAMQVEAHEARQRKANAWLAQRVDDLRAAVITSENAVQDFTAKNGLFQMRGLTLDDQFVSELNSRLVQAQADAAQAQAALEQATGTAGSPDAVPEVLQSPLIQNLRAQEAALQREYSSLSVHFGPKHPKIEAARHALYDLRGKIKAAESGVIRGLENEAKAAQARVDTLGAQLSALKGKIGITTREQTRLDELKREAAANRALYESFLTKLKQTAEAMNLAQSNAKIIAQAQIPLRPSSPNKPVIMGMFGLAGMFIALSLALGLDLLVRGFTSADHLRAALDLDARTTDVLGLLPEAPRHVDAGALPSGASIYAEALRRVLSGLQPTADRQKKRSYLIVSALPREGKGWLALALSRLAAEDGKRILLIDCDLHRGRLAEGYGFQTKARPLNDYLHGTADLPEIIADEGESGLHVIGSTAISGAVQPLLDSPRMAAFMDYAHAHYDLVFIDAPPIIGLSDIFSLARLSDQAIFVVRHGKTPRQIVRNALRILSKTQIGIAGFVLSRVPMRDYKRQEFGGGRSYRRYDDYYRNDNVVSLRSKILKFRANA
ncbi:MAG: GumC family protein [Bdellovibrionales bacterium]